MKNHFQFDKRIESVYRANAQGSNRKYVGLLFLRCKESDRGLNWDIRKKKKIQLFYINFSRRIGHQQGQIQITRRRDGLHIRRIGRILSYFVLLCFLY